MKQITKYNDMKTNKGKSDLSSAKRDMPDIHASQAFGFNHCRKKPSMNFGHFTFCVDISGGDVAIL
jgi:hypothetical protein